MRLGDRKNYAIFVYSLNIDQSFHIVDIRVMHYSRGSIYRRVKFSSQCFDANDLSPYFELLRVLDSRKLRFFI